MALAPVPDATTPAPELDSESGPYLTNSAPPATPPAPSAGGSSDEDEPVEGRMTFLEHLDELRRRITHAVVALLVGFVVAFAFIERIWIFVFARLTADVPGGQLIFTEPGEAFFLYIKLAAIAGLLLSSPYVMYQVWLFIAPGLYANEKKLAVPFVLFSSLLFISGAAFSHAVLFPLAWRFFASFSNQFLAFTPRVEPVFSLYVKLLLALGLVFQLPMMMFVLGKLGIVSARFLIKNFKYAVLLIFVVAAVVTPDGSMVVQVVMAAPMIALYGISILVVWLFGKKRREADEQKA
ncbi:MAG: twin-arginine translocase subunit TatC [Acidobacteriota bacterium]